MMTAVCWGEGLGKGQGQGKGQGKGKGKGQERGKGRSYFILGVGDKGGAESHLKPSLLMSL